MATAVAASYSGQSGQRVLGGRFPAGGSALSGAAALDGPAASGGLAGLVSTDWAFSDGATVEFARNTTTVLRTGLAGTETVIISPDLLPGLTASVSGGTLQVVGDATVPDLTGAAAGTPEDAIAARDVVIEVLENPIATIINVTRGITYEYGANYAGRTSNQAATRWNAVMFEANINDIIEVSPGAINAVVGDLTSYWAATLDSAQLAVFKPVTIRNMAGRGRWKPYLLNDRRTTNDNGIVIYAPAENTAGGRGSFVIEGFEFDNWGNSGNGVRIRNDAKTAGVYSYMHVATTFRNFKIGRPTGFKSLSGFNGLSETMTIEDGHVYDCGAGSGGRDHNLYIAARTMYLRGLRTARTRGWSVAPTGTPWIDENKLIEGHLAKLEAVNGFVEGCSFDCAELGDQSLLLQMKGGGNWIVRGNLFVDSKYPNVANGAITMLLEGPLADPNYNWFCGSEGNSLTFERNAYVGHFPRPIIWFFTAAQTADQAMYAIGDTSVAAFRRMAPLVCRDNIAMVTSTPADYMLTGFPGANNAMWINQEPNGGANWAARGNTVEVYSRTANAFKDKGLLLHRRALGPVAASGSVTTKRFLYPHGSMDRTDSLQGLG